MNGHRNEHYYDCFFWVNTATEATEATETTSVPENVQSVDFSKINSPEL